MEPALKTIADKLQGAEKVLVAAHIYPDCDALGSQLALGEILLSMGKRVKLFIEEPVSHHLEFLPGVEKLDTIPPDPTEFDCAVSLDCGDWRRLGKHKELISLVDPLLVVDHHSGHENFGDFRWVEKDRSSTAEMIYELALALDAEISYEAAYCLYAAIAADSGSFRYPNTGARTLAIAGNLVEKGVEPADISAHLYDNFSKNRLHLLQIVLSTLELYEEDRLAIISVTQSHFRQTATNAEDTELFINYPRALMSVKVAGFIKETTKDLISVSLRSKGSYDVGKVARKLGGGGHPNAAGFKVSGGKIEDVRQTLLKELAPLVGSSSS
ncbi:MAG: DHH family phosphoesterase [Desulfurivibrionaceae bacterium]